VRKDLHAAVVVSVFVFLEWAIARFVPVSAQTAKNSRKALTPELPCGREETPFAVEPLQACFWSDRFQLLEIVADGRVAIAYPETSRDGG
jgi:hypothetical protein